MSAYRTWFGVLVTFVAARVLYEGWAKAALSRIAHRRAKEASDRVSKQVRKGGFASIAAEDAPRTVSTSWTRFRIRFGGEHFDFNPWAAAAGGFAISLVCSLFGVGGGFLVTPFLASVLLFPMYLVVGTSLVALMLPLAISVITYLTLRVHVDWGLVASEVPGVVVGSFLGPALNHYFNEKALKTFVALILFGTGIYYILG